MKITENVHVIRNEFQVTPQVKRYVNIYLLVGKWCHLIDSGVAGSEKIIKEYLESIGRKLSDVKSVFLTHSHPDHMGGAAELKKLTGCKIYAPSEECEWIEDIDVQFRHRPIPNFYGLVSNSVKVDAPLCDGDIVALEEGLKVSALATPGHSHGSMSFVLNDNTIFTGDAIPIENDLPIFVDYEQSLHSLDRIGGLHNMQYCCPAWDDIYNGEKINEVLDVGRSVLDQLWNAVQQIEEKYGKLDESEKLPKILELAGILQYAGNTLVIKSVEACRSIVERV